MKMSLTAILFQTYSRGTHMSRCPDILLLMRNALWPLRKLACQHTMTLCDDESDES